MSAKPRAAGVRLKLKGPSLKVKGEVEREELKHLFGASGFQDYKQYLDSILSRVGKTPRQWLEWVLRMAHENPRTMMPGDWSNARQELAVFVAFHLDGWIDYDESIKVPSEAETRTILPAFREAIEKVIRREPVPLGGFTSKAELHWVPRSQRYFQREQTEAEWLPRAMRAMGLLIVDYGHLVRACPALVPRGKEGDTCNRWFVATRSRQEYCSTRCQTRASTKAYREGTETAAVARHKIDITSASRRARWRKE